MAVATTVFAVGDVDGPRRRAHLLAKLVFIVSTELCIVTFDSTCSDCRHCY